ncbi:MAG: dephospho-CoA kinase [Bdellovibrionales bacterium RIFCSPHIGHO2_01_FULL_40_29]|nr:MAG: dephospho-CoA kinase [Bdellovibrionales bacterium RIFCSPHIGHO2_01_FULL_40_29]OFZ34137.1 MAG: dephospho-CoA kinase [Bdellovibrionales bacterium RIFCSPHIGHO2_02_FULL_40_15]
MWIGLTGGIATGKSAAKKQFEGLGIPVIDADELAHQVMQPGQVGYQQVVSYFGTNVVSQSGDLNRSALAEIIFKSIDEKEKLESIIHPLVQAEVQKQKAYHQKIGTPICMYDVPLLFEKKLEKQFDRVILIWCDPQTQRARLKARNQLTDEQVSDRIRAQMPLSDKLPLVQHCIDNSTTYESLHLQVKTLVEKLKKTVSL